MARTNIQVYELPALGLRVFYTPPGAQSSSTDEFSYYSHKHPYCELHLILRGTLTLQTSDRLHRLEQGDFCLIGPGVIHAPKSDVTQMQRYCIGFDLYGDTEPADFLRGRLQKEMVCTGCAKQILLTVEQLRQESQTPEPFSREMTGQLLSQLILQMLRQLALSEPAPKEQGEDLNDLRTVHIDNFLNNSFHLQGAQQLLAAELGLSRRQLDRVFQKLYGCSFRDKLLQVRAEAACDLLRGDMTVARIAQRVGYSSSANFTAFFRNYMGLTPSQYRKKCR